MDCSGILRLLLAIKCLLFGPMELPAIANVVLLVIKSYVSHSIKLLAHYGHFISVA